MKTSKICVRSFVSIVAMTLAWLQTGCQTSHPDLDTGSHHEPATAQIKDQHPGWETQAPIEVSRRAFDASNELFQAHSDYLALNTPYPMIEELFHEVEGREAVVLKSRGESHVTVVTPPEAEELTALGLGMPKIDRIADRLQMGDADLDPICLGMGQAMINGKLQRTYFVVLHSENLLRVRREIERQIPPHGQLHDADHKGFEAGAFYPHITVGFTLQDLFEQNGVIKDRTSCLYPIKVMP